MVVTIGFTGSQLLKSSLVFKMFIRGNFGILTCGRRTGSRTRWKRSQDEKWPSSLGRNSGVIVVWVVLSWTEMVIPGPATGHGPQGGRWPWVGWLCGQGSPHVATGLQDRQQARHQRDTWQQRLASSPGVVGYPPERVSPITWTRFQRPYQSLWIDNLLLDLLLHHFSFP